MAAPLTVGYVTVGRAADVHEWSGLNAAIREAITAQGCTVVDADQLGGAYPMWQRARKRAYRTVLNQNYALERSPGAARRWSALAAERLAAPPAVDVVVSPGRLAVAYLAGTTPLAIWGDATFHALRNSYPGYADYAAASIAEGDRVERAALDRASLVCYASQWAADDAVRFYGVSPEKVRVIPFGANCESPFADVVHARNTARSRDWSQVRFVFIGVDWDRKGGARAVEVVSCLNQRGVNSVLDVIGCNPPDAIRELPYVRCLGFLSKTNPDEHRRLSTALSEAHFLLMPTTAECFGLVFAEAAAFAVPSITCNVGGVSSAVHAGRTGMLLPAASSAERFCDAVAPLLVDRERYLEMCAAAYRDFADRLNWRVAGAAFVAALNRVAARRVPA